LSLEDEESGDCTAWKSGEERKRKKAGLSGLLQQ
jgi:hypothetical protein